MRQESADATGIPPAENESPMVTRQKYYKKESLTMTIQCLFVRVSLFTEGVGFVTTFFCWF